MVANLQDLAILQATEPQNQEAVSFALTINNYGTAIPELLRYIDDYIEETHRIPVEKTEYPVESGVQYTDHIIVKPVVLTLTGFVSDALRLSHTDQNTPLELRGAVAFSRIEALVNQRRPIATVYTQNKTYQNMVITGVEARSSSETGQSSTFIITLEELQIVNISVERTTRSTIVVDKGQFSAPLTSAVSQEQFAEQMLGTYSGQFTDTNDANRFIDVTQLPVVPEARTVGEAEGDTITNLAARTNQLRQNLIKEYSLKEGVDFVEGGSLSTLTLKQIYDSDALRNLRLPRQRIPVFSNRKSDYFTIVLEGQEITMGLTRNVPEDRTEPVTWAGSIEFNNQVRNFPVVPYNWLSFRVEEFNGSIRTLPKPGRRNAVFGTLSPWVADFDMWYYPQESIDIISSAILDD